MRPEAVKLKEFSHFPLNGNGNALHLDFLKEFTYTKIPLSKQSLTST